MEKEEGRVYGYARVSTKKQNIDRQLEAIKDYCVKEKIEISKDDIFVDESTGNNFERPEYKILKRIIRKGDILIIQDTDRLGRNRGMVKDELKYLKEKGVRLRILNIPTTLIELKENDWVMDMVNNILIEVYTSIDEQDNVKRSERTIEGLEAARKKGKILGRRKIRVNKDRFQELYKEWKDGKFTGVEVQRLLGLSSPTFYRRVAEYEVEQGLRGEGKNKDYKRD